MATRGGLRGLVCPFILLITIYSVWLVRYPAWHLFKSAEHLFLVLILFYSIVLLLSIVFFNIDAERSLSEVFKVRSYGLTTSAIVFAIIFQAVWFTMSLTLGGDLEFSSFPSLREYESYAVYSLPLAFGLYVVFVVFGAFVEEFAFRGYVQSTVASRYGNAIGVFIASILFSLQHIHIFQFDWIERFFQTQFIYLICFGVFVGYFFLKTEEDIWSVFALHSLINIFNISLPIKVTYSLPFATQLVTIAAFGFMILLLRLVPFDEIITPNSIQSL